VSETWFVAAGVSVLVATGALYLMVFDVNKKHSETYSLFGWYPGKMPKIFSLHKQFYPNSKLRLVAAGFFVLALVLMVFMMIKNMATDILK
jgi:hypothetical protein